MMYHIRSIDISEIDTFDGMTFKAVQTYMREHPSAADLILLGAELFDKPIGMLTGTVRNDTVLIHSIFVSYRYRNIGVGTGLMHRLEEEAKQRGLKYIRGDFSDASRGKAFFTHLFRLHPEVSRIKPTGTSFKVSFEQIAEADWVRRSSLPSAFSHALWGQASAEIIERIRQGKGDWYPEWADPLLYESIMQRDTSRILYYCGEPVGWLVFHESQEDRRGLHCPVLFTRKEYEARGRSVHLLAETLRIAYGMGYLNGNFYVRAENSNMLRFASKRLGPYVIEKGEHLQYLKKF